MLYRCIHPVGNLEQGKLYDIIAGDLFMRGHLDANGMATYRFELVPGLDFLKFFEEL